MFQIIMYFLLLLILMILILFFYNKKEEKLNHLFLESISRKEKHMDLETQENAKEFHESEASEFVPPPEDYDPVLEKCQVPTLNTEQCYQSLYFECPVINGSYSQCTNNYIPLPKQYNADCRNRTFEMTPYPWKISENCYYHNVGFKRAPP